MPSNDASSGASATAQQIEAAIAMRPNDYALRMQAAQFYLAVGQSGSAVLHLDAAVRLQPAAVLAWLALGDARVLVGQSAAARTAYEKARRLAPQEPLVDRGLGQLLVKEGRLLEARQLLSSALRRHPDNLDLRLALGNLYLVLNRPGLAVGVLEPAAAAAPSSADVHYLLGQAHEANLHIEAALAEQKMAVAADPNFAEAWGRIGLYLIDLTRYAEARPPLERAIRINPREPHYYWALGNSYLQDASDPGHLGRAIDLYRQAVRISPNHERALVSLAIALTRRGAGADLADAARALEQSVRQNPTNGVAYYKLSETYTRLGRAADARQALARFRLLESRSRRETARRFQTVSFLDSAEAHLRLGRRHLAEGRPDLAATEFRLALQRDPGLLAARQGLDAAEKRRRRERRRGEGARGRGSEGARRGDGETGRRGDRG